MNKPEKRKPSVLLIAEAANPDWVSVPLIGWSLAKALREVADVHLVTQVRNRDAILRQGWVEGVDFTAIDTEAVTKPIWRVSQVLRMGKGKGWTLNTAVNSLLYPYFERLIWKRFQGDLQAGKYDVVHRITPVSLTAVSPLARKCKRIGVPFVLGPLNGGVPWPKGFDAERRAEGEWLSYFRGLYKLKRGRLPMYRAASAILVGSKITAREIPAAHKDKVFWLPENAIDVGRFNQRSAQDLNETLRACFIGRLVPCKGVEMFLEAAAPYMRDNKLHLDLIGDGPTRSALEDQAKRLGIEHAVTFHGNVAHEDVQGIAVKSNLLAFPSIRDFGGGVVLEAMALGIAPLVIDYAGPAELVTARSGVKVPLGSRDEIIAGLRAALDQIFADPSILPEIGKQAHARIHEKFTWPAKAEQIATLYRWVMDPTAAKPVLLSQD